MRRNSEEAYKSELSLYLRNLTLVRTARFEVREERSDSQCDIAIGGEVAIELKKSPSQADYDRCFGQVARHLNQYKSVIVIICDVTRRDTFEDFSMLIDQHFPARVRVFQNG